VQSLFDHHHQAAIIALFRVVNRYVGNLPPMLGVFPDYPAPVVRNVGIDAKGWLWKHESGTYVKFTQACSRRVEQSNDVIATDSPRRRFPACHGERKNSLPSFPILARVDITNHSASCIGTGGNTSALYIVGRNCHVSSFYLTDRLAHSQRSGLRRDLI
jgi:hypothetical protein